MSSYDKVVKLACKPKAAPPKSKYIDPIIAATWSEDGAVHDVCKALAPRIREPNTIIVFKALIVLHTMIRNGSTDNVLSYLSSSEVLRLRDISSGNWEGYATPQNLQVYALYLDSRIRAYKDLKHDAIRVQAESNRDLRTSASIEEDGGVSSITTSSRKGRSGKPPAAAPINRRKTISGRKLRSMTVEKGLLRETKVVHGMIDALVECRFYLDDLEDELATTALRMLVKDLLILFQAGNEGVINVLENYFEMSHVDASEALTIYRHFCKQTDLVVEYLGVARKLQNLLNVPVPNLKHAPVSLAGALQEYLDDPNFEQNRVEYKANKEAVDRVPPVNGKKSNAASSISPKLPSLPTLPEVPTASTSQRVATSTTQQGSKDIIDFFSAIEEEHPNTNPQNSNTGYVSPGSNPFAHMANGQNYPISLQPTGFIVPQQTAVPQQPNALQPTGFIVPQQTAVPQQSTGFIVPQQTAVPRQPNFGNFQPQQQPTHRPFSSYLMSHTTGFPQLQSPQTSGFLQPQQTFLQPQATGSNPFRQSMLVPQSTGMALFGASQGQSVPNGQSSAPVSLPGISGLSSPFSTMPLPAPTPSVGATSNDIPARPSSTPLTSYKAPSQPLQPVKSHQTGTRNPFGPITSTPPPIPKAPTLLELKTGMAANGNTRSQNQQSAEQPLPQHQTGAFNKFSFSNSALNPGAADISSVASSFAFSNPKAVGSTISDKSSSNNSGFMGSQQTGTTSTGSAFSDSRLPQSNTSPTMSGPPPVTSHITGFGGLKPFIPSSSFGASLLESLPIITSSPTNSTPGSNAVNGLATSPGGANQPSSTSNGTSNYSFLNNQPTGATGGFGGAASPGGANQPPSTSNGTSNYSFLNNQPTGATGGFGGAAFPGGANQPSSTSNGASNYSFLNNQPTGATGGFGGASSTYKSSLGVGLRPQMTGGGAANPFRASSVDGPNFGAPTVFQTSQPLGANFFGINGGAFGTQGQPQPQPYGTTS